MSHARTPGSLTLIAAFALMSPTLAASPSEQLGKLFDEYWESALRHSPTWATELGDHRYNDQLEDLSEAAYAARLAELEGFLARVRKIAPDGGSPRDQLNAEIFERVLSDALAARPMHREWKPLNHLSAFHMSLPLLQVSHPFKTEKDLRDYAKRLRGFPKQVDDAIACLKQGMAHRHVLPKLIVRKIVPQIESQLVGRAEDSELYRPLKSLPDHWSEDAKSAARADVAQAIVRDVVPAYRALARFVEHEYLPAARDEVGIWAVPDGDRIYERAVRLETTTELTPEEIHRFGLAEIARIEGEMNQVRKQLSFDGTVAEFIVHMSTHPEYRATSGEQLVELYGGILERTLPRLPKLFGRLPKARCEMKVLESFRAPVAPVAYYNPPAQDGSRPGYYYVNTYQPQERVLYIAEALSLHEAVPGHHLQIALDMENTGLPKFRRHLSFTGYVEGWGLYSEKLGEELGCYQDPVRKYGQLAMEAWRAARLVVDTGMHHKRWPREKAVVYMREHTGLPPLDIDSEIDRYIAWPGQALAYKVGERVILKLRAEATQRLGDKFDVRAFHDELLREGAVPLNVLERRMKAWIERQ